MITMLIFFQSGFYLLSNLFTGTWFIRNKYSTAQKLRKFNTGLLIPKAADKLMHI